MVSRPLRLLHSAMVLSIKAYQRLFLDLRVWGRENIPAGPKIYITNHITAFDSFWVLPVFPELVHIVIGPGYHQRVTARLLDAYEQINAMPAHRHLVVPRAVEFLRRGEAVYLAPEGDLQPLFQLGRFYPGVARIYRQARVPIVPIALVAPKRGMREYPRQATVIEGRVYRMVRVMRGPFCINIGAPCRPEPPEGSESEQDEHVLSELRAQMTRLIEEVRLSRFWLE
ncbi:MAG: 1-acyl-sn-glycerol-3-phosphate acyltransferase [Planctomycetes bacterium]|nr:1-acyl-sn-glycerol-3-phosphate acyltransferase [Planctomycetota bacterium]